MQSLTLLTSAGVERFRKEPSLGQQQATRQPLPNAKELQDQFVSLLDEKMSAYDGGQYDNAPESGVVRVEGGQRVDTSVFQGTSQQGELIQQTVARGGQMYTCAEFRPAAIDAVQASPGGASYIHIDREHLDQSYVDVIQQPWQVFDNRPTSAPELPPATSAPQVTTPSGLKYAILEPGTGPVAESGQSVLVDYSGWLDSGKRFDSSLNRGEPFEFQLGAHNVIAGWDEGVAGMKVGETRRLSIPSELGYGANGAGSDIPPNAPLTFDVHLLATE